MRIGIVSDGKFDDRAFEVIRDSTRWNESWIPSMTVNPMNKSKNRYSGLWV